MDYSMAQSLTFYRVFLQILVDAFVFDLCLRPVRIFAVLVHEISHLLAAMVMIHLTSPPDCRLRRVIALMKSARIHLGDGPPSKYLSPTASGVLSQCVPGTMMQSASVTFASEGEFALSACASCVVKTCGLLVSIGLPWLVLLAWRENVGVPLTSTALPNFSNNEQHDSLAWTLFCGTFAAACGAIVSDLPCGPLSGAVPPRGRFCCGNWGLMVARSSLEAKQTHQPSGKTARLNSQLFPDVCERLLRNVLDIVELRGAQAGGCMTFVENGGGRTSSVTCVRTRVVKTKRGRLGQELFLRLRKDLRWMIAKSLARLRPFRPLPVVLVQGHSRFGTSSLPAVIETHPHQWIGSHNDVIWRRDEITGDWRRGETDVCVTITHNGDFDGYRLYDVVVPNGSLGDWLFRVLGCNNPAKGDSAKLAGMMDLLVSQGSWHASVRLAFVQSLMTHADEAFFWEAASPSAGNAVPAQHVFKSWASVFDSEFSRIVSNGSNFAPTPTIISNLANSVCKALSTPGAQKNSLSRDATAALSTWSMSDKRLKSFCECACQAFFGNDLLSAVWEFFSRGDGTFGITVTSSLWPSKVVVAAKGQPMAIAFDVTRPLVFWASEPSSLNAQWKGKGFPERAGTARLNVDDAGGEAFELQITTAPRSSEARDRLSKMLVGTCTPASDYIVAPGSPDDSTCKHHILIRGCSLAQTKVPATRSALMKRWIRLTAPCNRPTPLPKPIWASAGEDPIQADLREVPAVLAEINEVWSDRSSFNRQSATRFADCLSTILRQNPQSSMNSRIDVLVFGVENSLWLGQQFAADLSRVFPRLRVTALSSNWVLGLLQSGHGHIEPMNFPFSPATFTFSENAIALAVSQSGTTYPTVWAARLVSRLRSHVKLFALSADFDTVLAGSIGHDLSQPTFSKMLFSTNSGIRPSEPSTVATIAMHHTFTRLLLHCAEQVTSNKSSVASGVPEIALHPSDVQDLKRLSDTLVASSEQIVGYTEAGQFLDSSTRRDLLSVGKYLGSHLIEGCFALLFGAVVVWATVSFGYPPFGAVFSLIVTVTNADKNSFWHPVVEHALQHFDAIFYIFLGAILTTAHRLVFGRRPWSRYTSRSIVVVDSTVNYKLVRAYASKLRALAPRFTIFGVAGQNGLDHFVHEYTHLAHSDAVLMVGRPDGRLGSLAAMEAATIMSVQQAKFIASAARRGIEAISFGHNPWTKESIFSKTVTIPTNARPPFMSSVMMNTDKGGCAPGTAVMQAACVNEGAEASSRDGGIVITMNELKAHMGTVEVSHGAACFTVMTLLEEQQERLDIDVNDVNMLKLSKVVPKDVNKRSPATSDDEGEKSAMFKFRKKSSGPQQPESGQITAPKLMSVLRGDALREYLHVLQSTKKMNRFKNRFGAQTSKSIPEWEVLWMTAVVQEWRKTVITGVQNMIDLAEPTMQAAETVESWRAKEDARRLLKRVAKAFNLRGPTLNTLFQSWRGCVSSQMQPIHVRLLKEKKSTGDEVAQETILSDVRLTEALYETRVAAAERLLSFFVVFHRAVKPLSLVPGLKFDMDRSESRLRVASTPAPVPFVETLPALTTTHCDETMSEGAASTDTLEGFAVDAAALKGKKGEEDDRVDQIVNMLEDARKNETAFMDGGNDFDVDV
eukprot:TRINITY_DN5140_c0_g1_i1.p1 TRINITY_DN5140_c0_g1~~TRINITY_DN5140_c0_g1_i1.p1  ORF type:complete len:1692 (+),score=248.08 TRINITY_DN5140_c0_g1_i1:164-5077(+)